MDETMPKVSELLNVKILNAGQAYELFTLRAQTELNRLLQVRNDLVEEARKTVGAPAEYVYNTDTMSFQPKAGPVPLSTERKRQAKRAQRGAA